MPATYTDRLDGLTTSVAIKAPCRVATTAAITLSGIQTVDGVLLAVGDRVLVKDQSDQTQNGIWIAQSGAWTRALDFNGSRDVVGGSLVRVSLGTSSADSFWSVAGAGVLAIGVDDIAFDMASGGLALGADLAASGGAALIGRTGGGTVQDLIDMLAPFFETYAEDRKLTVQTLANEVLNGLEVYHHADQTDPSNQTLGFAVHNYTDGTSVTIDTVGNQASLRLKQANNASARPDKASTYVGDGIFLDIHRARTSGAGNLGTGNDRLAMIDENGCYTSYGPGAADWAGLSTNAPIKLGSYTGFLTKLMYMGFDYANDKAIIGSIDNNASVFKPLDVAASALRPIGDNEISLGAASKRWTYVHALNVVTSAATVATLPAAATAGAGARAFVTDATVAAATNFGIAVTGGGSNKVPVYSDGATWFIG